MNEANKKGNGFAIAAALFFLFAVWFASLGIYLHRAMINYKPAPNEVQEGDMVSALVMMLLFGAAGLSLIAALYSILIFSLRLYWSKKDSAN